MSASISHDIKKRTVAKDVFITPIELAKKHIDMIDFDDDEIWLDPCKNDGSYYNNLPTENKKYCEILENKDFFNFNEKVDIIIQNPPYSILNLWIQKNIDLNPRIISLLICVHNLTAKRIEMFEKGGYGLTKLRMLKVWDWYGMSYICVFEKNKSSIMEIDRTVYR